MKRLLATLLLVSGSLLAQDAALLVLHKGGSSLGFYSPQGKLLTTVPVLSLIHI